MHARWFGAQLLEKSVLLIAGQFCKRVSEVCLALPFGGSRIIKCWSHVAPFILQFLRQDCSKQRFYPGDYIYRARVNKYRLEMGSV